MQEILVFISFIAAIVYITDVIFGVFSRKKGCEKCSTGGCSSINFEEIQKKAEKDSNFKK